MDPQKTSEKIQRIFKQGTEQIIGLFENFERVKLGECMEKNVNNMNDFVKCSTLAGNVLEENKKKLEIQIMFCSLHVSDCLNVNNEDTCKESLKQNLTSIYNEYRSVLN